MKSQALDGIRESNVQRPHSSFWRASAAGRSLGGQVAVMQALAAFWKFVLVQTQGRSALFELAVCQGRSDIRRRETLTTTSSQRRRQQLQSS